MYDLVIIGSGPAGMAAAIYAKRACLQTILIERTGFGGGQVLNTYEVDNYPGLPGVSGFELAQKMNEHVVKMNTEIIEDDITKICEENGHYLVCGEQTTYETKGIVIATGAKHAHLNVPGEGELAGMGVSYCATCDGAFFTGRDVAVVGGGDVAVEDAIFLARNCRKVYLIHRRDKLRAAQKLQEALKECPNVEILWNTTVKEIKGEEAVSSLTIRDTVTSEENNLPVAGVFIAVGILPNSEVIKDMLETDEAGYIKAGEDCKTSRPFLYAVGDVRTKPLRQVVTAVADGANAISAFQKELLQ